MKRLWAWTKDLFWLVVAVALVGGGFYGYQLLAAAKPEVEAAPTARPEILVDAIAVDLFTGPLPLRGEGFVTPFRQVALASESAGRIVEMHPALENRERFKAGDVLVRLDDQTQSAALEQTIANIASTQARLALNETQLTRAQQLRERGVIAQDQLDTLNSQKSELTATLSSLEAARRSAEVSLSRSEIRAPFDGAVLTKSAELGSVVSPGTAIATLYTIDQLEVSVPIGQTEAALIPGLFTGGKAAATVSADFAGQSYIWNAEVARVDNALDARTRTLTVTLRLGARGAAQGEMAPASGIPPALINGFAQVVIDGARLPDIVAIPSTAFRDGDQIWLYQNGKLLFHPATRIHVDGERSFVQATAIPVGAAIVTSSLDTVFADMPVRRITDQRQAAATE